MKKEDLKIVFLGTPEFAVESLKTIHENGFNIVGVVTMPDKPAGRGHKMYQSPVKDYAVANGLKVMQPVNLKDEQFVEELRSLQADLFVVIAFRMLPKVVWTMPPLGTFNLHASLLPRYRGAAPINRAVMNGDTETGVTTFFLKHEIDTGDIIDRESITIDENENVGSVHDRLMALGARLTLRTLDSIVDGTFTTTPQDSITEIEPTPAPKIFKEDCKIDWSRSAREIHNHVRGLSPYPAAWTVLTDGQVALGQLKVFGTLVAAEEGNTPGTTPGTVVINDGKMFATSGNGGLVEILEVQLQGKSRMSAADFLRGRRLEQPRFE